MRCAKALFIALLLTTFLGKGYADNPPDTHLFTTHSVVANPPLDIVGFNHPTYYAAPIPFDLGPFDVGGDIQQTAQDTVTINSPGRYSVTFSASTYALDTIHFGSLCENAEAAEVQAYLNDIGFGPEVPAQIRGTNLYLDTIAVVPTVPATLKIKVNTRALRMGKSNAVTLKVYKLSDNP